MTTVETEPVLNKFDLDEFDLDIQIDETDLPVRKYAPYASQTRCGSCSWCCSKLSVLRRVAALRQRRRANLLL